jgi:hypothetical protein
MLTFEEKKAHCKLALNIVLNINKYQVYFEITKFTVNLKIIKYL